MTASRGFAQCIHPVLACALLVVVPHATCAAQTLPDTAEGRFKALDTNHDGVVSRDEYESTAAFAAMDTDHNSRISPAELEKVIGPQQEGTPSASQRIGGVDINGDQELSDEEIRRALETRFQWLDSNQDGTLDLPEMKAGSGVPFIHQ